MKTTFLLCIAVSLIVNFGCKKEFLDKKPSSAIIAPSTLEELESLLENTSVFNLTTGLPQLSADEYTIVSNESYLALPTVTERNAYIWKADLYQGEAVSDWNKLYEQIFYANSVLDVIAKSNFSDKQKADKLKGWASFVRAYAYFDLARNFCKVYNPETANSDLGLPIRTESGVDVVKLRSTLQQTFDQIIHDLDLAATLLDRAVLPNNRNRPSKAAAFALKARIYLYMGRYNQAEISADNTLQIYNKLIDYNTVNTSDDYPFNSVADEVIYISGQNSVYGSLVIHSRSTSFQINPEFYDLYRSDDLRKPIFFRLNEIGKVSVKRGYLGYGFYPFTGLATDEILLIKAECLARRGQTNDAMTVLDELLVKRYNNQMAYIPLTASNSQLALAIVLEERKKELIFRGLRWSDLKRFNRDGANITISRSINNQNFTLSPNDPRYVFPIPDQEISLSGIQQNLR